MLIGGGYIEDEVG